MKLFRAIFDEIVGMFVDDGMSALLCVLLIIAAAAAVLGLGLPGIWAGLLLLVGCVAILAWSVLQASR